MSGRGQLVVLTLVILCLRGPWSIGKRMTKKGSNRIPCQDMREWDREVPQAVMFNACQVLACGDINAQ